MAVALTSIFVQPMLIANQSSNSSSTLQLSPDIDHIRKDGPIVCPSPSASPSSPCHSDSLSQSPTTSVSPNESLIACKHRKDSTPYSDITEIERTKTMNIEQDDQSQNEDSLSMSQCRYCYADILCKDSVSQCHCSGVLCKDCLTKEIKLCHGRGESMLQCTVCKSEHDVKTEFTFNIHRDCNSFCIDFLIHCGLKDEQYLLDSVGGKIGFFLVILGINTWILSTSLLFAFPPNGCPIELYYMVSVFDFAVGISTIWFIIKCRYLSPFFLSIMYFIRFLYILLGWIPSINLCNIYIYHDYQSNHVSILSYFLSFSFIASAVMCICWIIDLNAQYKKYKKENGKLILLKNDIKIEINDIVNDERDQY